MAAATKICPGCGVEKPLSEYYRSRYFIEGYTPSWCKPCHNVRTNGRKAERQAKDRDVKVAELVREAVQDLAGYVASRTTTPFHLWVKRRELQRKMERENPVLGVLNEKE